MVAMMTREEIEANLKRIEMQIELLTNGMGDAAARSDFNADSPSVQESHALLKHLHDQKELLESELRRLDSQ
jgi:hypothetical protein